MSPTIRSQVTSDSPVFATNTQAMLAALEALQDLYARVVAGGTGDAAKAAATVTRHRSRGKLLPRERIALLADPGAPFLELSPLAGWGTDDPLGGGLITGIARVHGVQCVVIANDPTVKGGSMSPTAVTKSVRAMDIARENRLPVISLVESGGADLTKQVDVFTAIGATFRNLTQLSAAGIPTIALVFGSSTAGGAYVPGMSDYVVMQADSARVYLGGPPLVKMAIDEDADEESLGGAQMHASVSGVADYLAADELDALRIGRDIVAHLGWPTASRDADVTVREPLLDPEELLGIASADVRVPFEAREVLARILDGSELEEFKPLYGSTLVTGWGTVGGHRVGVLANNGILFSEEAQKGAQFIQLCERIGTPLLFFQNITGFMVGTKYEQRGIIKDGAKLINAVANCSVPKITVMIGASYGAGNYGMSGRAYGPRFVFTWPNHRLAVMGPKQLAGVMTIVARQAAESTGKPWDEDAFAPTRAAFEEQVEQESTALFATGRMWDDGIIDPRDTRTALTLALDAVTAARDGSPAAATSGRFGVFRM